MFLFSTEIYHNSISTTHSPSKNNLKSCRPPRFEEMFFIFPLRIYHANSYDNVVQGK